PRTSVSALTSGRISAQIGPATALGARAPDAARPARIAVIRTGRIVGYEPACCRARPRSVLCGLCGLLLRFRTPAREEVPRTGEPVVDPVVDEYLQLMGACDTVGDRVGHLRGELVQPSHRLGALEDLVVHSKGPDIGPAHGENHHAE